jgi:hypothetical protein
MEKNTFISFGKQGKKQLNGDRNPLGQPWAVLRGLPGKGRLYLSKVKN